jgi:hypothetical protein
LAKVKSSYLTACAIQKRATHLTGFEKTIFRQSWDFRVFVGKSSKFSGTGERYFFLSGW